MAESTEPRSSPVNEPESTDMATDRTPHQNASTPNTELNRQPDKIEDVNGPIESTTHSQMCDDVVDVAKNNLDGADVNMDTIESNESNKLGLGHNVADASDSKMVEIDHNPTATRSDEPHISTDTVSTEATVQIGPENDVRTLQSGNIDTTNHEVFHAKSDCVSDCSVTITATENCNNIGDVIPENGLTNSVRTSDFDDEMNVAETVTNESETETNTSPPEIMNSHVTIRNGDETVLNASVEVNIHVENSAEVICVGANCPPAADTTSGAILRAAGITSLVAEYRSDASTDTEDSSSDSDDSSSTTSSGSVEVVAKDSDHEQEKRFVPRTKGELFAEDLPPLEDLCITVDEATPLVPFGKVSSIVGVLVVVQSEPDTAPLDMDSIIFTEDRKSLGQVFETFGPVKKPYYSIRFNSVDQIQEKGVEVGMMLYCAPSVPDYTHFVFMTDLRKQKGSDASWMNNNEPPPGMLDFSDDEQERMALKMEKEKRKQKAAARKNEQWPPPDDGDSPDSSAPPSEVGEKRPTRRPKRRRDGRQVAQNAAPPERERPKPPQARFGAPPMFHSRPMPPQFFMRPPVFVGAPPGVPPGGPPPPIPMGPAPPMYWPPAPPGQWPQWPAAPQWPRRPHPNWSGGPRPHVYSSQAEYWAQYGK